MMFDEFLAKAAELLAKSEPFVTAAVVRFEAPISGKPGDKAIILQDGKFWGWIGGGCAQPVVIKEALKALADGHPRLIRISPTAEPEHGIVDYTMTCHSGGTLDIYIEPVLPKPHILILGRSPVAQTLARLGKAIHYRVSVVAAGAGPEQFPDADALHSNLDLLQVKVTPDTFIVVSTQGEGDEEALLQAARADAGYLAFVASKAKARKVLDYLREAGVPSEQVSRVRAPAGVRIGAGSPEEIAVSILAEIIETRAARSKQATVEATSEDDASNKESRDPVCGMQVNISTVKFRSEHHGSTVYFCCAACKQAFDKQPEKYALSVSG
jgi:xanthine dehydrogenase accessory factor